MEKPCDKHFKCIGVASFFLMLIVVIGAILCALLD